MADRPISWLGLVARNLLRRPGRAAFTLLGVALAVASYLALTGLTEGLIQGVESTHSARGVDLAVTDRGVSDVFAGSLPLALGETIRRHPEVAEVAAELDAQLDVSGGEHAIVAGWREDEFGFRDMRLKQGRRPRPGAAEVVLGESLAQATGAEVGGQVELNFSPFRVVGIATYENPVLRGMAFTPLEDLQALISREDQATLFQIRLRRPGDAKALERTRADIAALRSNLGVSTTAEAMRSSRLMQMVHSTSFAISIVALAIGCLSVLNTLAMGVEERTRDIGILGSIGWPRRRILALILSEGLVLAGLGGLLGIALGWIGHEVLSDYIMRGAGLSAAAMAGHAVRAEMVALLVGMAGALAPAWRAARMRPAAALRRQ